MPFAGASRLKGQVESVWTEFTALARTSQAVNIGQGFPDTPPPAFMIDALNSVLKSQNHALHQYTRGYGHPRLVNVLSKVYSSLFNHDIDPLNEISITIGGYSALYFAFFALIDSGDEVIIIEPYFDCYSSQVTMAGGIPVFVPLRISESADANNLSSGDFQLDFKELESKLTPKTKMIVLNNPNNPLGKVFTRSELTKIADLAAKHDLIVVSDEVYEWHVYPDHEMIRFASLPGMWDRTITIGSAGKVFSVTGWKIGWAIAPVHLMTHIHRIHQNCAYTSPTLLQEAIAIAFENQIPLFGTRQSYFTQMVEQLTEKREKMRQFLTKVGLRPIVPEGGYFMMADYCNLHWPSDKIDAQSSDPKDYHFVRWLCKEKKLAGIPPSAFYGPEHKSMGENYIRFCFYKDDSTLNAAAKIMTDWSSTL